MKICLVHEEYPEETNFGGIATYQKRVAEEYVKQGHTVYVIARGLKKYQHYTENGVNITRIYVKQSNNQIDNYIKYREKVATELKRLQRKKLIDIIEVPDWGAESVLFEKYRKVPLVVRLHTPLKVWLKYNKNNFGEVSKLMLTWEDLMIKNANLVTCCSTILKNIIVKDFNISSKKIIVTPNPANTINFKKDNSIMKENRLLFVGSLEERKGVCVLAKALNIIFKKLSNIHIDFIGKNTKRNNKDISTIDYIKQIIKPEYQDRVSFLGQLPNSELNYYYNRSKVAIFPSLFDNFPYVTLEAMATGIRIVGSRNSGMTEMIDDNCLYKTPDHKDLARLICNEYKKSLTNPYNEQNIKKVNSKFNSTTVCKKMLSLYKKTISDYHNYYISTDDIQKVLKCGRIKEKIINITRETGGVANAVYRIETQNKKYILKRYNYKVNFKLSKILSIKYKKLGLIPVLAINKKTIRFNKYNFNIFPFVENTSLLKNFDERLVKIVLADRKYHKKNIINDKCQFYYSNLKLKKSNDIKDKIDYVLKIYEKIKDEPLLCENFINHGDISRSNILVNDNNLYIIDFDETTIAPNLYDFAVISIKFFMDKNSFNFNDYNKFKQNIISNTNYNDDDCNNILKFYLCKILLEKYYLHTIEKIDIFSKEQQRDNFIYYHNLLNKLDSIYQNPF